MRTVFLCFDSSREKRWGANGQISREQMKEIETEYSIAYEQLGKRRSESLNGYLSIALMHHHPFTFKDGSGTMIQKFFDYLVEIGLRLHDAENFHHWCGNKKVSLVLHGHKHIPRHVQKKIVFREEILREQETFILESIGCGTSLGAENYNMSYDVLFWDPVSSRWAVTFWQDSGQGIFKRQFVKTEPQ
jgi:3',5'-cyclic AMP phosphodiesterase CpdA